MLLAGATGYIGARLARELLQHDYELLCPVRDPRNAACRALEDFAEHCGAGSLTLIPCNLVDRERTHKALERVRASAICSCIASRKGGVQDSEQVEFTANHNLLEAGAASGAKHFSLLSAICVQKPRLAFQQEKLRFEEALTRSGISHSIVRPTAFFKSLSGQVERVKSGKPFLMFGNGELTRCKPIAEGDLATYIRLTLEDTDKCGVLPIGGPGPAITPRAQAELLARLTQQKPKTRSVSPTLLSAMANAIAVPGRLSKTLADKAEFVRIGHYYATESMLLWDVESQSYDEDATPEFGTVSLEDSYRHQLSGKESQSLGEQAVF